MSQSLVTGPVVPYKQSWMAKGSLLGPTTRDWEMMRSTTMISSVVALLAVFVAGAPKMDDGECCQEKQVGDTFYTRLDDDSFSGMSAKLLDKIRQTLDKIR